MDTNQPANKFDYWRLILLIPLVAVLSPAIVAACYGAPLGPAMLIGIPIGIGAVVVFTLISGNDLADLVMSSLLVIVLSVMLTPIFLEARRRSLAVHEKANITMPATVQTDTSQRRDR
jgi:hypothetical protein